MEAINYVGNQNLQMPKDAQIVPGVSGNAMYYPAGKGTAALAGDRNELSVSLWRRWDGIVNRDAERGIFRFKNLYVYFDSKTELLTVELAGVKNMSAIKDDRQQTHWCFVFAKNNFFSVYKNARLLYKIETGNYPIDFSEGFELGGGHTHAIFDEIRIYKAVLPQSDINGLYYLVTKGTNTKHIESVVNNNMAGNVASYTPKYLGACATVPPHRTVVITKGEQLGAVDANKGDWVLMTKNTGGWKQGVCYRWEGSRWVNLEPVYNYDQQYQCCLLHLMEIPELKEQTGHFGAILCGALVSQRALIDELVANQAFIKKLVVQQLRIDSDPNSNQDFEAWFDKDNGLKVHNYGKKIFEVSPTGGIMAQNIKVVNGTFEGEINCQGFQVINKEGQGVTTEELFSWDKGDTAHTCICKIMNVGKVPFAEGSAASDLVTQIYYGEGSYNGRVIRVVKTQRKKIRTFNLSNCRVVLISNDGSKVETISSAKHENRNEYNKEITDPEDDLYFHWHPSEYNFRFFRYVSPQKVIIPNIRFGRSSEPNELYRDEDGFVKIS